MNVLFEIENIDLMCYKHMFGEMDYPFIESVLTNCNGRLFGNNIISPSFLCAKIGIYCIVVGCFSEEIAKDVVEIFGNRCWIISNSKEWLDFSIKYYGTDSELKERFSLTFKSLGANIYQDNVNVLPKGYVIKKMDMDLANKIKNDWCKRLYGAFETVEDFCNRGVCFCIMKGNKIVSGISSHSITPNGFELQIMTHENFRRIGLAKIATSKFILYCLENNKIPYVEAATEISKNFAQKLGFSFKDKYPSVFFELKKCK